MHICLIYNEYPKETDNGGIATYQYNLARALISSKNQVTVIASSFNVDQDYLEDGIRVIRLKNNLFGTFEEQLDYRNRVFKKIQEINKENPIDIIETPEMGAEALICVRNKNIPIIVKLHTSYKLWSEMNGQLLEDEMHNKMILWENEQLNKADAVISCSKLLKKLVEKDIYRRDICVIPNPIDSDIFYYNDTRKNSDNIVYCGSLEYRKGVLTLIKAIPIVISNISKSIVFQLIGKDSLYNGESMISIIYKNLPPEYHDNIKIYGYMSKEELNLVFNNARIGVVPSLFDNLPYVVLEELLTELPIIISDNTGISEELNKNKAAFIFKSNDYKDLAKKIIEVYYDEKKLKSKGANGRNLVINKYSYKKISKIMLKKYNETIKKYKRKEKK